jgi:hypothetical protein
VNTDVLFLQDALESKKKVEVKYGPFASYTERKVATAIQKYMVLWSIAMFWLSFPKMQTIETYLEMLIAIVDSEQLMPSHPDCVKEARVYPVAFIKLLN